jgi:hypothetical protein
MDANTSRNYFSHSDYLVALIARLFSLVSADSRCRALIPVGKRLRVYCKDGQYGYIFAFRLIG